MDVANFGFHIFDDDSEPELVKKWKADLEAEGYRIVEEGGFEKLGNNRLWKVKAVRELEEEIK